MFECFSFHDETILRILFFSITLTTLNIHCVCTYSGPWNRRGDYFSFSPRNAWQNQCVEKTSRFSHVQLLLKVMRSPGAQVKIFFEIREDYIIWKETWLELLKVNITLNNHSALCWFRSETTNPPNSLVGRRERWNIPALPRYPFPLPDQFYNKSSRAFGRSLCRHLALGIHLHDGGPGNDGLIREIGRRPWQDDIGLALDTGGNLIDLVILAAFGDTNLHRGLRDTD